MQLLPVGGAGIHVFGVFERERVRARECRVARLPQGLAARVFQVKSPLVEVVVGRPGLAVRVGAQGVDVRVEPLEVHPNGLAPPLERLSHFVDEERAVVLLAVPVHAVLAVLALVGGPERNVVYRVQVFAREDAPPREPFYQLHDRCRYPRGVVEVIGVEVALEVRRARHVFLHVHDDQLVLAVIIAPVHVFDRVYGVGDVCVLIGDGARNVFEVGAVHYTKRIIFLDKEYAPNRLDHPPTRAPGPPTGSRFSAT